MSRKHGPTADGPPTKTRLTTAERLQQQHPEWTAQQIAEHVALMASPRERFKRLAEKRVNTAIKRIQHVANLSNKQSYESTDAEREAIVEVLTQATQRAVRALRREGKVEAGFKLF